MYIDINHIWFTTILLQLHSNFLVKAVKVQSSKHEHGCTAKTVLHAAISSVCREQGKNCSPATTNIFNVTLHSVARETGFAETRSVKTGAKVGDSKQRRLWKERLRSI